MPDGARILQFRRHDPELHLSAADVRETARRYLEKPFADRSRGSLSEHLSDPDVLFAVCGLLKDLRNVSPLNAVNEATLLHAWLVDERPPVGIFDERQYLLGEVSLVAAAASRLLGRREDADLWLDRAEAAFRSTVNPAPSLSSVSYERLALHYERRNFRHVSEIAPALSESFAKLNMPAEAVKCWYLEACSLKDSGRHKEAQERLERLKLDPMLRCEPVVHGLVLSNLGELYSSDGRYAEAVGLYEEALSSPKVRVQPLVRAKLNVAVAETLRETGQLARSVEYYRAGIRDYSALGMLTMVAYLRVVVSETLIALERHREAEWEILAALPIIEEQKMVPEGFAAVALLKEAVWRRKANPNALRELREHLQAKS